MKKIALLAVSTLFVVACSDDNKSAMGEKAKPKTSTEFTASTTDVVVFTAGQNKADLTGCDVKPNPINPKIFKEIVCASTNGVTVEEAKAVSEINITSLSKIKDDSATTIKNSLVAMHEDIENAGKKVTKEDMDAIKELCEEKVSETPEEYLSLRQNECEVFNAALREQKRVDAVETMVQSGSMMIEESEVLAALADQKEEEINTDLNQKLNFQKKLLRADRTSESALKDLEAVKAQIANQTKDIKELRAESERLKKEGEETVVNSASRAEDLIVDSVELGSLIRIVKVPVETKVVTEEKSSEVAKDSKKEEAQKAEVNVESPRDGYDLEPVLYDALPEVKTPEVKKPEAIADEIKTTPKVNDLSDVTETGDTATTENPFNGIE